ncbi:MAG: hypothetical protein C0485_18910 [Pirellula sp.]|nr:hypothetical protein [Pirellula sp.]
MNQLLLIAALMATASDASAQSEGTLSIRSESKMSPEGTEQAVAEEALRRAVWHSTEMLDARAYVLVYSERSAQSSRSQGEAYLRRVSQLSSDEMLEWLERLQQQRAGLEGRRLAEEEARELSAELAVERRRQAEQAGINAQLAKAWLTETWWQRQAEVAETAESSTSTRKAERAAAVAGQRLAYDPLAPTLDPASPPRWVRAMAAASLPGDLPRGDPANFSRGDDRGGGGGIPTGGDAAASGAASGGDAAGAAAPAAGGGGE